MITMTIGLVREFGMRLKRVYIEITNVCNLSCEFCKKHHRENRYMTKEEFEHILDQIKNDTKYIYLHVKGEPLLHPEVDTFVKLAYEKGFYINLTTNRHNIKKSFGNNQIFASN